MTNISKDIWGKFFLISCCLTTIDAIMPQYKDWGKI